MWSFSFYSDRLFKLDKINDKVRKEILYISSFSARVLGLKFSSWLLRNIAGYVKEKKI
jgi:hypothetical protein